MKPANSCKSIEEVREAIDKLDSEIILLLGKRFELIKEVVRFKEPNEASVVSKSRLDVVISTRREMAIENELDPDVVESIYRLLIDYFISEEKKLLKMK